MKLQVLSFILLLYLSSQESVRNLQSQTQKTCSQQFSFKKNNIYNINLCYNLTTKERIDITIRNEQTSKSTFITIDNKVINETQCLRDQASNALQLYNKFYQNYTQFDINSKGEINFTFYRNGAIKSTITFNQIFQSNSTIGSTNSTTNSTGNSTNSTVTLTTAQFQKMKEDMFTAIWLKLQALNKKSLQEADKKYQDFKQNLLSQVNKLLNDQRNSLDKNKMNLLIQQVISLKQAMSDLINSRNLQSRDITSLKNQLFNLNTDLSNAQASVENNKKQIASLSIINLQTQRTCIKLQSITTIRSQILNINNNIQVLVEEINKMYELSSRGGNVSPIQFGKLKDQMKSLNTTSLQLVQKYNEENTKNKLLFDQINKNSAVAVSKSEELQKKIQSLETKVPSLQIKTQQLSKALQIQNKVITDSQLESEAKLLKMQTELSVSKVQNSAVFEDLNKKISALNQTSKENALIISTMDKKVNEVAEQCKKKEIDTNPIQFNKLKDQVKALNATSLQIVSKIDEETIKNKLLFDQINKNSATVVQQAKIKAEEQQKKIQNLEFKIPSLEAKNQLLSNAQLTQGKAITDLKSESEAKILKVQTELSASKLQNQDVNKKIITLTESLKENALTISTLDKKVSEVTEQCKKKDSNSTIDYTDKQFTSKPINKAISLTKNFEDSNWKSFDSNLLIPLNQIAIFKVKLIRTRHVHVLVGISTKKDMGTSNPQNSNETIAISAFNGYVYENGGSGPLGMGISDGSEIVMKVSLKDWQVRWLIGTKQVARPIPLSMKDKALYFNVIMLNKGDTIEITYQ